MSADESSKGHKKAGNTFQTLIRSHLLGSDWVLYSISANVTDQVLSQATAVAAALVFA